MALFETLFGGGVGQLVKDVIGSFRLDPAVKAQIEAEVDARAFELAKIDREFEAKLLDAQTREAEIASSNIRAEAASDSWLAKNCRPAFIFGAGMTLLANIWMPLIAQIAGRTLPPFTFPELPSEMYWLFGTGFLGYTGARSYEKSVKMGMK